MRKQGGPLSRRKQAVTSLLNMPFVADAHGWRSVRRRDRRGPVLAENLCVLVCRDRTLTRDEGQEHRAIVRGPAAKTPRTLFLVQLAELEVGPELTKPAVAWIAEQGRTQFRTTRVVLPRQAQPLDPLAQHVGVGRLALYSLAQPPQTLVGISQADRKDAELGQALVLVGSQRQRAAIMSRGAVPLILAQFAQGGRQEIMIASVVRIVAESDCQVAARTAVFAPAQLDLAQAHLRLLGHLAGQFAETG